MIKGTIIKGIGGFYYIKAEDEVIECKARGKLRKDKIIPMVGDKVSISIDPSTGKGSIEEILPRQTELLRPPVANIDQAIIVFSIKNPDPNLCLLDKFLVSVEKEALEILICVNKADIDIAENFDLIENIYSKAGYVVLNTSTKTGEGIDFLKGLLKDKITVFAGPSGVGKSSLLNAIQRNLKLQTGEISEKNKRGKHTTRHVELLELEFGGWVLDTPGFSSLDVESIEKGELQHYFKDFLPLLGQCKYQSCIHLYEPECMIKKAMIAGDISKERYDSYIQLLEEIQKTKRRY